MRSSGTINWPQVNLGSIMWPEIYALFSPDYAQKSEPGANFYGVTMIEPYYSMSVEQKVRKFSLIGPDYWVVPFLKYALWKHKVAKAANLWVKLHFIFSMLKKPSRWVRGAPNVSASKIYHRIKIYAMIYKEKDLVDRTFSKKTKTAVIVSC